MALSDLEIIQRAADELPAGVWIARAPGGGLVYANKAFREILTTGYARNEESESILDLGARELVSKPYGIETLHAALRRILDERARRS